MTSIPKLNAIENHKLPFLPAGGVETLKKRNLEFPDSSRLQRTEFNEIFRGELNKLKFSGHAISRVESREVNLDNMDMERLNKAYDIAESKGAKNPLVMLDEKAFLVNVPNQTIITVLDKNNLKSNVITNIDSVIFV